MKASLLSFAILGAQAQTDTKAEPAEESKWYSSIAATDSNGWRQDVVMRVVAGHASGNGSDARLYTSYVVTADKPFTNN
jgi:hypothetical protein